MRQRLSDILVSRGLAANEKEAQGLILAGKVLVNDQPETKTGAAVEENSEIRVRGVRKFVSRGGEKLDAALEVFHIPVAGRNFMDIGSATGGFTDALLQRGAAYVAAIDVGRGLLHQKLMTDERVQVFEGADFKSFDGNLMRQKPEAFVADVSFASLDYFIPRAFSLIKPQSRPAEGIVLFKPQFELKKSERSLLKKGVLEDREKSASLVAEFTERLKALGVRVEHSVAAAITGRKGNQEYVLHVVMQ